MSEPQNAQTELNDFEAALRSLLPLPSAVSRDELMFRAGQASVEQARLAQAPRRWMWPVATAASALVAAMLGLIAGKNDAEVVERFVHVSAPAESSAAQEIATPRVGVHPASTAYVTARNRILARGVDSLPTDAPSGTEPAESSLLELRNRMLRRDRS